MNMCYRGGERLIVLFCRASSSFCIRDHLYFSLSLTVRWSSVLLCAESLWWSLCVLWSATGCSRKVRDNSRIVPHLPVRPAAWSLDGQPLYCFSRSLCFHEIRYYMCYHVCSIVTRVRILLLGLSAWLYCHDSICTACLCCQICAV